MHKLIIILVSIAIIAASASCGSGSKSSDGRAAANDSIATPKSIVIYFSHAGENYAVGNITIGNTRHIADFIIQATGADRWEVEPERSYDMPLEQLTAVAREEQEQGIYPAYKGPLPDLRYRTTIYVGGPVWWGTYPQVLLGALRQCDLNGKTIIPFTTHEGSEFGRCVDDLKRMFPKATFKEGFAVYGHQAADARDDVEKWLRKIGEAE